MKLIFFIITLSVIFISCNKEKTVYNGYIKNDTSGELTFKIIADSAVADSFNITSKSSKLVVTYEEEGDFEIFDCNSLFDTLYFTKNDTNFALIPDSSNISTSALLNSRIRTHNCIVSIQ